jgi:hypothetical protein
MRILDWFFKPDLSDWMGDDPEPMIEMLRGRASERKLRLFAAACCRRVPESRLCWAYQDACVAERDWDKILTTSEQYADGAASSEELQAAIELAERVDETEAWQSDRTTAATTAVAVAVAMRPAGVEPKPTADSSASQSKAIEAALQVSRQAASAEGDEYAVARAAQAELLREIFGNPFSRGQSSEGRPVSGSGVVVQFAREIYEDRVFDRLPALAEALERQGYRDAELLGHCRRAGGHVRGCWVLDLILGKS